MAHSEELKAKISAGMKRSYAAKRKRPGKISAKMTRAASSPEARAKAVATLKRRRAERLAAAMAAAHAPEARAKAGATNRLRQAEKKAAQAATAASPGVRLIPLDAFPAADDKPRSVRGPYRKGNGHVERMPGAHGPITAGEVIALELIRLVAQLTGKS